MTGWRLPDTNPINGSTYNYNLAYDGSTDYGYNISAPGTVYAGGTGSEMAYLFYNTLGNLGYCDPALSTASSCSGPQPGWGLTNTGPFSNVQSSLYWSATEYAPDPASAWGFDMDGGGQYGGVFSKSSVAYAWAVHTGDVGAVPVPAAVWLFGSGLVGLIGVGSKRRR